MTGQWGSVNGLLTSIDLLTLTLTTLPAAFDAFVELQPEVVATEEHRERRK